MNPYNRTSLDNMLYLHLHHTRRRFSLSTPPTHQLYPQQQTSQPPPPPPPQPQPQHQPQYQQPSPSKQQHQRQNTPATQTNHIPNQHNRNNISRKNMQINNAPTPLSPTSVTATAAANDAHDRPASPTPLFPFRWNIFAFFNQNNQNNAQQNAKANDPAAPTADRKSVGSDSDSDKENARCKMSTESSSPSSSNSSLTVVDSLKSSSSTITDASSSGSDCSPLVSPKASSTSIGCVADKPCAPLGDKTSTASNTNNSCTNNNGATNTTARRRRQRPLHRHCPRLSRASHCLPAKLIPQVHAHVPARFGSAHWQCVYSTMYDGASLGTLYSKCRKAGGPSGRAAGIVIMMRDTRGAVFGCYVSDAWHVSPHYYGTGETFVFSVQDGSVQVHRWTRANSLFQLASPTSLALGGGPGGGFALFIDSMLERGASRPCDTFGSPCLASADQFDIVVLEAYALVPPHRLVMQGSE